MAAASTSGVTGESPAIATAAAPDKGTTMSATPAETATARVLARMYPYLKLPFLSRCQRKQAPRSIPCTAPCGGPITPCPEWHMPLLLTDLRYLIASVPGFRANEQVARNVPGDDDRSQVRRQLNVIALGPKSH